jgi:periplasmic protein TonB
MEPKKTTGADLGRKTFLFFNVGLIVALSFCIFAFTFKATDDNKRIILDDFTNIDEPILNVPPTDVTPPPRIQNPVIIEIPDDPEKNIEEPLVDIDLSDEKSDEPVIAIIPEIKEAPEDPDIVFVAVEESAAPVGGIKSFYEFVSKKIKYPSQAKRMQIEGRVFIEFIIEKDGSLTDVKTLAGIGGGCDQEAERIVRMAPKWNPGKQRGKPVRQKMVLPIIFQLN